ncbi:Zinc transporter 2 [Hordeum vulgare]|nr:Zinc transporter 2 [Hordeum vulgare]
MGMASPTTSRHLLLLLLWICAAASTAWAHGGGGDADADADAGAGDGDAKPDLRARGLVATKLWCLALVFAGTLAGGVSPYFMRWNEAFLALGTQFAGGVFLGTAMMHFLSDANETFADLVPSSAYPFAFMLACAGYVLTMLAECAISSVVARGRTAPAAAPASAGALEEGKLSSTNGNGSEQQAAEQEQDAHSTASMLRNASTLGDSILLIAALCFHSVFEGIAIGVADACKLQASINSETDMRYFSSTFVSLQSSPVIVARTFTQSAFQIPLDDHPSYLRFSTSDQRLAAAETKADAWKALWTISLHKVFAAVAMGIALLRMLPNRPLLSCFAYAFAFAVSSPIGVGIGIVIDATAQGAVADWIFAVSMGLATGIFVYVSVNHLLAKGYKPQSPVAADTPLGRWLAVVLGVGVIAVVMIWDT